MIYKTLLKRPFDIAVSAFAILVFSPVFIITALAIIFVDGPPVIFKQDRVGLNKKHFNIYKFKTMRDGRGPLLSYDNDPRVTKLGFYLRKHKIDELPQFFNVIIGNMSLVGPRPEVPQLAQKRFKKKYNLIFCVKPGITGLSSIKFIKESGYFSKDGKNRYEIYFSKILPQKISLDIRYIQNISFAQDLKIIIATLKGLLS